MKKSSISLSLIFSFGIITLCPSKSNGQLWDLGTVPYGLACSKEGIDLLPGLIEDPWILTSHCLTYNGTVGCFDGLCRCNQREDAIFNVALQICVGRVGAICSAEHSNFFHDKLCTINAYCAPTQSEGHSVGKCECIQGYVPDENGRCFDDPEEGEKGTARTTTTTTPAPKEDFKLPPLNLLIGVNHATFDEKCQPKAILNRTICDTYSRTVSCLDNKCQCNMQEDSIFDEELNMCVGRVGTYCLGRKNILGYKVCTKFADCVLEGGKSLEDGYSFGTCNCIHGFKEKEDGTCERDPSIPNPSTQKTILPSSSTTTTPPETNSTTTTTTPRSNSTSDTTPETDSTTSEIPETNSTTPSNAPNNMSSAFFVTQLVAIVLIVCHVKI